MNNNQSIQPYAFVLWVLLVLFVFRVSAQMAVAFLGVAFLPPMEEWSSGVFPYPYLLVAQFLIIALLLTICLQFFNGKGWWVRPNRRLSTGLLVSGSVYLLVMIIRYILRMSLYPPERWAGGSIPTRICT